jgi:hypothetical protein
MHSPTREGRGGKRVAGWGVPSSSALRPTGDCGRVAPAVSRTVSGHALSRVNVNAGALALVQSLDKSFSRSKPAFPARVSPSCRILSSVRPGGPGSAGPACRGGGLMRNDTGVRWAGRGRGGRKPFGLLALGLLSLAGILAGGDASGQLMPALPPPAPQVSALTPSSGPAFGGTRVVVTGYRMQSGATLEIEATSPRVSPTRARRRSARTCLPPPPAPSATSS